MPIPRVLRRNPTFAAIVISGLALVMGLSTTIIGVVDGLLYPQYPLRDQAQLFRVDYYPPTSVVHDEFRLDEMRRTVATMVAQRANFFDGATTERFLSGDMVLEAGGRTSRPVAAKAVGLNYFELLGIAPQYGRLFGSRDADALENHIVISDALWRSLRRGSADRFAPFTASIPERQFTVIGVLPRGAEGAVGADVLMAWSPVSAPTLIRAKPGFDRARVAMELSRLNAAIAASLGVKPSESAFIVKPMIRAAKPAQRLYLALIASAVVILLVAGANLANVQLARGMARRGEFAIRMALGASRRQLVGLIAWESAQLAALGAVAGLVLALFAMQALYVLFPDGAPGLGPVRPQFNWRVLGFAALAALLCSAVIGVLPALSLSSFDLSTTIKAGGSGQGAVRARNRRYAALVVAQVAASLALAIGAGLIMDAGLALHRMEFGYDVNRLVGMRIRPPRLAPTPPRDIVARIIAEPGVQSAAAIRFARYGGDSISVEDAFGSVTGFQIPVGSYVFRWVTPELFRTLGVRVTHGSDFPADDAVPAVIVDSIAAAQIWPGAIPVGRMIRLGGTRSTRPFVRVIGVVPHLRWDVGVSGDAVQDLQVYYVGRTLGAMSSDMTWGDAVARSANGVVAAGALRNHLRAEPAFRVTAPWADFVGLNQLTESHDLLAVLFGSFAILALLLAASGVYSVVAYSVACRRREMGVRMALGASRERIFGMVLSEETLTTLMGLAIGLVGSQWGAAVIGDVVFATGPVEQLAIIAGATALMLGVAVVAAGVPGLRAARVSPAEALRAE